MTRFRNRAMLMRLALLLAALAGCATETRMLPERAIERPGWIDRQQDALARQRVFVGVALADDVLDEAQGRAFALEDAAENLLRAIARDIEQKPTSARAAEEAQIRDLAASMVAEAVKALRPVEFYREKWFVRETNFGQGFWRYKFYVLAECDEDEYNALAERIESELAEDP